MLLLPLSLPGPFINLDFDPPTGHVSNSHSPPNSQLYHILFSIFLLTHLTIEFGG